MTYREVENLVAQLDGLFDLVRVVDVSLTKEIIFRGGDSPKEKEYECYASWRKKHRCNNCVSAKALLSKGREEKFEFVDNDVYFVISKYIEVEESPYLLEMVTKTTDETLWDADGKNQFQELISGYTRKVYTDSLTGVYNRRYYDEQLCALSRHPAVAVLDVDNFKLINDTYGHTAGDAVLQQVAGELLANMRTTDIIVRYGGDEFLIVMRGISPDSFFHKMEFIRKKINRIRIPSVPDITVSVSIGAGYFEDMQIKNAVVAADKLLYEAKVTKNSMVTSIQIV